ncbi:hypothetical protein C8R45DRAFT_144724 [Mycena sanguinolenta]|nr:hypothetical protein C8R45DRAFT_144724 [Mycena sanguinolenta]
MAPSRKDVAGAGPASLLMSGGLALGGWRVSLALRLLVPTAHSSIRGCYPAQVHEIVLSGARRWRVSIVHPRTRTSTSSLPARPGPKSRSGPSSAPCLALRQSTSAILVRTHEQERVGRWASSDCLATATRTFRMPVLHPAPLAPLDAFPLCVSFAF